MSKYPNSGIFSRNKDKQKETQPDFKGSCEVDGKKYWISGWVKEGKQGKFFSLSFKEQENRSQEAREAIQKDFDDDIPF